MCISPDGSPGASGRNLSYRNHRSLWLIWSGWGLLIACWLIPSPASTIKGLISLGACGLIISFFREIIKGAVKMSFFSKEKHEDNQRDSYHKTTVLLGPTDGEPASKIPTETMATVLQNKEKNDTFISRGATLTGAIEGGGHIIVEGNIDGNLSCSETIRIEHSGSVKGVLRTAHIMINGYVDGSCYAETISIQPKGHMQGDIFTDNLSIEKGSVFVGQSHLTQTPVRKKGNVTALNSSTAYPGSDLLNVDVHNQEIVVAVATQNEDHAHAQ